MSSDRLLLGSPARILGTAFGVVVLLAGVAPVGAHGGSVDPTLHGPTKLALSGLLVAVGGGVAGVTQSLFRIGWAFSAAFHAGDVGPYEAPPRWFTWFVKGLGGVAVLIGGWLVVDGSHLLG
ncbi:MAG: hypothetical protein ABEJ57_01460 [Halobacteriaceae archaeon]